MTLPLVSLSSLKTVSDFVLIAPGDSLDTLLQYLQPSCKAVCVNGQICKLYRLNHDVSVVTGVYGSVMIPAFNAIIRHHKISEFEALAKEMQAQQGTPEAMQVLINSFCEYVRRNAYKRYA